MLPPFLVSSNYSLASFSSTITQFVVKDGLHNDPSLNELDLSSFECLQEIDIGNGCFQSVVSVRIVSLKQLVRVTIGENCFNGKEKPQKCKSWAFQLKSCPKLLELKIGNGSFCNYSICQIEDMPLLTLITIGDDMSELGCFGYSSLELKSCVLSRVIMTRHASITFSFDREKRVLSLCACRF